MSKLQPVRGTKDIQPDDFRIHQYIIDAARRVGGLYGFEGFATPIFEFTDVFKRTLGDTSDVVNKEMYTFEDRGGESLTLRPEFTAGIARAFISNGMQQNLPLKLFSHGSLFRYERPQKGRQRQFHQINFEWLGEKSPYADVEMILMAKDILDQLGISKNIRLEINSLGDRESRENYKKELLSYLRKFEKDLSDDSKNRLEKNPLRILDSKDNTDKEIVKNAPILTDYLTDEAAVFFDTVKNALDIEVFVNPKLVRGLDYYSHTVFEFISFSEYLGSQNTVLAGGRYDGLIKQMGGADTPAIGFAAGIERLALASNVNLEKTPPVAILPFGNDVEAVKVAQKLRSSGYCTEIVTGSNNFGKRMKKADKLGADVIITVREGQDIEITSNTNEDKVREIKKIV